MRVFWFIYTALMCAPAGLAIYIFYSIFKYGSVTFNEPTVLIRDIETISAFILVLLAIAGWIIASVLLFRKRG